MRRRNARQTWVPRLAKHNVFVGAGGLVVLAAAYFASAKLGLSLAFVAEQVSAVWPPSGIALAAFLLLGNRVWPGILAGAFFANVTANEPIGTAAGIALGNTLEAFVGAWLLRNVIGFDNALARMRDAIGLIVLAAIFSTMLSATIGVTSLALGQVYLPGLNRAIEWGDFWTLWSTWWIGDAIGVLIAAPMLLTWATREREYALRRPAEAFALFGALVGTSIIILVGGFTANLGGSSLAYIVFPFVIWAALRLGPAGTATATFLAAGVMIWATLNDLGPFTDGAIHERLVLLQIFMGVVAVTSLLLGAALAERRRAEAELRRGEEELRDAVAALQQVDRRKDEFLATLAHELRNPLAPIRAGADYLRMIGLGNTDAKEVLEMLDRQLQQMTRLVDDLLDVSRVTRGKIRLQLQPVELSAVIDRAVETSRPLIDSMGHELTVSLPEAPLRLEADPTRLAQVFANLLNNAAKYTRPGGRIIVSAAREDDSAVVRVRDTGHGIDPAVLPHVFDLFVQSDRTLSRPEGGLGIGLTLVKSLVEMHGGSVRAFSEGTGKGSQFRVTLPLAQQAPEQARRVGTAHQAEAQTGGQYSAYSAPAQTGGQCPPYSVAAGSEANCRRRVLIVDDNVDAARSLELLLRASGHDVQTAHAGAAALELVPRYRPDVVLLDIGLPKLDGYEVARRIRQQSGGEGIVLIAVTGWGQPDDRRRAVEAGFDHHLTKPVDVAVLSRLLNDVPSRA